MCSIDLIEKLMSMIKSSNSPNRVKMIGFTLKGAGIPDSEAKNIFNLYLARSGVKPPYTDCNDWDYYYPRTQIPTITTLHYLAHVDNKERYAKYVRKDYPFNNKSTIYWSDIISILRTPKRIMYKYFDRNGKRCKPFVFEARSEIEGVLSLNLASCIRYITTRPLLLAVRFNQDDPCDISRASEMLSSYSKIKVPTVPSGLDNHNEFDSKDYKYISVLEWAKHRPELNHTKAVMVPYHLDQPDPVRTLYKSNVLNLFQGYNAKLMDDFAYPEGQDFTTIESFNNPAHPQYKLYPYLRHIYHVFSRMDWIIFIFLINWFSWPLRFPREKTGVVPVLIGGQGTGKSTFIWLVMQAIYGAHLAITATLDQVTSRFGSISVDNIMVIINETSTLGDVINFHAKFEYFKTLVSDLSQAIEYKGVDAKGNIICYTNYIICSNNDHCVKIEKDDRRFAVFECSDIYKNNKEYHDQLVNSCKDAEFPVLLYNLLRNLPPSWRLEKLNDPHIIPETDIRQSIIQLNKPKFDIALDAIFNGNIVINHNQVVIKNITSVPKVFISSASMWDIYQVWARTNHISWAGNTSNSWFCFLPKQKDRLQKSENRIIHRGIKSEGYFILDDHWNNIIISMEQCDYSSGKCFCRSSSYGLKENKNISLSEFIEYMKNNKRTCD
jgi:hypothetical protein